MKNPRLPCIVTALTLAAMCGTNATANVLSNGKLDAISIGPQNLATPTGWQVNAYKAQDGSFFDGCSSEPWCNVEDPGGYGLFFKPFQGAISNELSVEFYQDNPGVPGAKYTLSGYAAGELNYSGYLMTNTPPPETLFVIHFLDEFSTVIASNTFDLITAGLPAGGPGSMSGFPYTTPQVTAPPGTATVRAGVSMLNTYGTGGSQSFFVDALDLQVEFPEGAPVITNQPANTTVWPGDTAVFTVGVSNTAGVTYQWQSNQVDIVDGGKFSGTSTPTLTISNVSSNEVARYRVRVTNSTAIVPSDEAALAMVAINFYPAVTITGQIGDTYRVDYATQLAPSVWIPLSTNVLTASPQLVVDSTAPGDNTRFYRAILVE
jgi:hypothetical protein